MDTPFVETRPRHESLWRAIVLFGRNSASYKFALARALLDLAGAGRDFVRLDELAVPYARHLAARLREAER